MPGEPAPLPQPVLSGAPVAPPTQPPADAGATNPLLAFDAKRAGQLYRNQDWDGICEQFLGVLIHLRNTTYLA